MVRGKKFIKVREKSGNFILSRYFIYNTAKNKRQKTPALQDSRAICDILALFWIP
jgi:hypothetical protein